MHLQLAFQYLYESMQKSPQKGPMVFGNAAENHGAIIVKMKCLSFVLYSVIASTS